MKLTREGKRFLLATLLIAVAALNTGNNLIYLILSLMLSFAVLSYTQLRLNLAKLLLEISIDGPVFAGDPAYAELIIHNRKGIPAYSLNIHAADAEARVYCGHIPAKGAFREQMRMVFRRRGVYGYRNFVIRSGFPFILFEKSIPIAVSGKVMVYPRLMDMDTAIAEIEGREEQGEAAILGKGDEVYSLREYRYGDDWRRIHWKASARQSALLVREYAEYLSGKVTILVDNLLPHDEQNFEKAVSASASLARHFIERGHLLRLVSCGKVVPFGDGDDHLFTILDVLAILKEEEFGSAVPTGGEGLLISVLKTPGSMAHYPAAEGVMIYADSL
jgi:uncharacterized protein (DUF58 family)